MRSMYLPMIEWRNGLNSTNILTNRYIFLKHRFIYDCFNTKGAFKRNFAYLHWNGTCAFQLTNNNMQKIFEIQSISGAQLDRIWAMPMKWEKFKRKKFQEFLFFRERFQEENYKNHAST